jgi:hypothetical protein
LYLSSRQAYHSSRFVACQGRMLVKQQDKPKALHGLDGHGSAADGGVSLLQELSGESTKSGTWSWHRGFRSLLGFLRVHLFLQKSAETTTLFVKRTT